jgi:hypothetical protein
MKRLAAWCGASALAVMLFLGGCGDNPTRPEAVPGQLALHLITPNGADGAVLVRITSTDETPVFTSVNPQNIVMTRDMAGGIGALVIGDITSGELLRFAVADVGRISAWSATILEVADAGNSIRPNLTGYRVELRVVQ